MLTVLVLAAELLALATVAWWVYVRSFHPHGCRR